MAVYICYRARILNLFLFSDPILIPVTPIPQPTLFFTLFFFMWYSCDLVKMGLIYVYIYISFTLGGKRGGWEYLLEEY